MPKKGYKHTPESRAKMSASHKGKKYGPMSLEERAKRSASMKGRKRGPMSLEHRQKIGEAGRGRKPSPETLEKMSIGRRAAWESLTPEERKQMADARRGEKRSPEACRRMGDSHRGKPQSSEHRASISAALKQYWDSLTPEQRKEKNDALKEKKRIRNMARRADAAEAKEIRRKAAALSANQSSSPQQSESTNCSWSPEHRARFVEAVSRPKSPQHRQKISDAHKRYWENLTPDEQAEMVRRMHIHNNPSSVELVLCAALEAEGIAYEPHYPLLQYTIDVAFPDHRLAVEVDGEYWHSRPETATKDQRRDAELEEEGWKTLRFSEDQIQADITSCIDLITQSLS